EADRVGETDRAVVVEARLLPVGPGDGIAPAQEMLPPSQALLAHTVTLRRAPQPGELFRRAPGVGHRVEACVEADLVTALVEAPQQCEHPWVVQSVAALRRA